MKARILIGLFACLGTAALFAADGNPPERMTYQGFLTDGNGNALAPSAPKAYDVIFRAFDSQSGGNLKWSEQQTVTVDKGFFSVLLGEGSAVGAEPRPSLSGLFSGPDASDRYVALTVKSIGSSGGDLDILPRLRVVTSPYSYLATKALGIVGGVDDGSLTTNVALLNRTQTFTGALTATNSGNQFGGTFVGAPTFAGAVTFNGGAVLNDKPLYLRGLTATNYLLQYDATADGPLLAGIGGGRLGTKSGTTITDALRWNNAGQVGVGMAANSSYRLAVNGPTLLSGDVSGVSTLNVNTINVSTVNGGNVYASGWFYCSFGGAWWQIGKAGDNNAYWFSSDRRLKQDIATYPNAVGALKQLRGVTYHWNEAGLEHLTRDIETKWKSKSGRPEDDQKLWAEKRAEQVKELGQEQMGFIAQEVEAVFPQWVSTDEKGFKQINMQKLGVVLVNAVREQQDQIDAQQKQIDQLKALVARQSAALEEKEATDKRLAALEKALTGKLAAANK